MAVTLKKQSIEFSFTVFINISVRSSFISFKIPTHFLIQFSNKLNNDNNKTLIVLN